MRAVKSASGGVLSQFYFMVVVSGCNASRCVREISIYVRQITVIGVGEKQLSDEV